MYEIGMSSDGRKEPVFDSAFPAEGETSAQVNLAQGHNTIISAPFLYEEEPKADAAAILPVSYTHLTLPTILLV